MGWMTQKTCISRSQSQSGGYHTVFRSVKQVTCELDSDFVNFSTESQAANIKMPADQYGLCAPIDTTFKSHNPFDP